MKFQAKNNLNISIKFPKKSWQFQFVNLPYQKSGGSKGAQKGSDSPFNMSPLSPEKWGKVQSNKVHVINMGYK